MYTKAINALWVEVIPDLKANGREKGKSLSYLGHSGCGDLEYESPFLDPSMSRGKSMGPLEPLGGKRYGSTKNANNHGTRSFFRITLLRN